MTNMTPESSGMDSRGNAPADTDTALQRELARERAEGRDAIGDVAANRNLSGSSTWETLPAVPNADGGRGASERTADESSPSPVDGRAEEFQHAKAEIAVRLRRRGVRLTGHETGDELTDALDAVERFEEAVQRNGGDLMVDEPIGGGSPIAPDNEVFVLPRRDESESIPAFIERITLATARAKAEGRRGVI